MTSSYTFTIIDKMVIGNRKDKASCHESLIF